MLSAVRRRRRPPFAIKVGVLPQPRRLSGDAFIPGLVVLMARMGCCKAAALVVFGEAVSQIRKDHLQGLEEPDTPIALSLRGRLWAAAAAAVPEDRVLYRASGTEGVCGLLADGYHYLRRNRGHARAPVTVLTDVTGGG
ncbi:hypothetical protein Q7P35_009046 [Cladosporium inversicolor]